MVKDGLVVRLRNAASEPYTLELGPDVVGKIRKMEMDQVIRTLAEVAPEEHKAYINNIRQTMGRSDSVVELVNVRPDNEVDVMTIDRQNRTQFGDMLTHLSQSGGTDQEVGTVEIAAASLEKGGVQR